MGRWGACNCLHYLFAADAGLIDLEADPGINERNFFFLSGPLMLRCLSFAFRR